MQATDHDASTATDRAAGLVNAAVYGLGRRIATIGIDEAGAWSARPGHVVWIGLLDPDESVLKRLQHEFSLHDLAIEDAGKAHQRPKIEQYGDGLFIVARTAQMAEGRIAFGETHLFVGKGYVVTVRHGASKSYTSVRERCEANPAQLAHGEDFVLYAVLDFIVDNFMDVIAALHDQVEDIEDLVLKRELGPADIERLHWLRRDLLKLRGAVLPLVDVCRWLENTPHLTIDEPMRHLFRDVTDHVRRVQEEIESSREVLAFSFEASLMLGQSQQTEITRKLSSWAAILAVPTAIAGIYGMNFETMPELKWAYGYPMVVASIVTICSVLFWRFKRNRWL